MKYTFSFGRYKILYLHSNYWYLSVIFCFISVIFNIQYNNQNLFHLKNGCIM
ncbi:hypothetical protein BDC45DRAFT_526992, partial [Circinella umbellata]